MIEDIAKNLSKLERSVNYNNSISFGITPKKQALAVDLFERQNNISNPIEETKPANPHQAHFDEQYENISSFVNETERLLGFGGDLEKIIKDCVTVSEAIVDRYNFNSTFYMHKNRIYFDKQNDDGTTTIETIDNMGKKISDVVFKKEDILSIVYYGDDYDVEMIARRKNPFTKYFVTLPTEIKEYRKKDKNGEVFERVVYSKAGYPEKYEKTSDNTRQELLFDSNDYMQTSKKSFVSKYTCYKDGNKFIDIDYAYSLPAKYKEYDLTTGKLVKMYKMQGLKNRIYRYALYNSLSGNLIKSGKI